MNFFEGAIYGIVQGLTEFLPVSSTGHIIFISTIFNFKNPSIFFDIILHLGTLFSLLIYFRKIILKNIKNRRLIFLLFLSTLVTTIFYLLFKNFFEESYEKIQFLPYFFIITSIYLLFFYFKNKRNKTIDKITVFDSIVIGASQSLAILPGISRSGFTFITSLLLGIKEEDAFKYSFLLSIPAIFASFVLKSFEYIKNPFYINSLKVLSGFLFSFIFGIISINLFYKFVKIKRFIVFSIYLLIIVVIIMIKIY